MVMVLGNEVFMCLFASPCPPDLYYHVRRNLRSGKLGELIFLTTLDNKLELLANVAACYLHFSSCLCCHEGSSKPPRESWRNSQGHRELIREIMIIVSDIFKKSWQIREALGDCSLANFSPVLQIGEKKVDFTSLTPHQ